MQLISQSFQWFLGFILLLSSIGVLAVRKPIYASLSFLLSLLILAIFYSELSAEFIAVMQILVYAGAILVIFVFVIILFQDAYERISNYESKTKPFLLSFALTSFLLSLFLLGTRYFFHIPFKEGELTEGFGSVQGLGKALYLDFFFPFEAVTLLFLVAIVGALYIAKREK